MSFWVAGVTVDNQTAVTVQSLLDTQSLSGEGLPGATVVVSRPQSKHFYCDMRICVHRNNADVTDVQQLTRVVRQKYLGFNRYSTSVR